MQPTEEFRCFICGQKKCKGGNKCEHKGRPKSKWAAHIAMRKMDEMSQSFIQIEGNNTEVSSVTQPTTANSSDEDEPPQWMSMFNSFMNSFATLLTPKLFKESILLDNQSGNHLFCNPGLVGKVEPSPQNMDVHTNAGVKTITQKGRVDKIGTVWYDQNAMTNILSQGRLADDDDFDVDYIKKPVDEFVVTHIPTGRVVKFIRQGNHYMYKPQVKSASFVSTVKQNKSLYSRTQVTRAKRAKALMESLMVPTYRKLRKLIVTNQIQNCPVTDQDCVMAEDIYGKSVAGIKGKSTRSKPTPAVENVVPIPKKLLFIHKNVHICINIMYFNELPIFTSISKQLMYRTAQYVPKEEDPEFNKCLDNIFSKYNNAGYCIRHISADNQFRTCRDAIKAYLQITVHYSSAQEHVPKAERNHRSTSLLGLQQWMERRMRTIQQIQKIQKRQMSMSLHKISKMIVN